MSELTPEWAFTALDIERMMRALELAREAGDAGEVPVGAVVVDAQGAILAESGNRRERDHDPTAHAELLVLRSAARARGNWRLDGCTLYATLEPCAMCAAACVQARLAAIVFAAPDPKAGFVVSVGRLLADPRLSHRVSWRSGLMRAEARSQLDVFFAKLRNQG